MKLRKDYFLDESMILFQDEDHFHFNTDTKLLAKFMRLKKDETILDIGTNNGALLLAADQEPVKELIGVEILKESSQVAEYNAKQFFKHPYKIMNQSIQEVELPLVDVIVCNPPFFKKEETNPNVKITMRQLGRIEENLTLEDLCFHANRLLKSNGRFYFVHRLNRLNDIFFNLHQNNFSVRNFQIAYDHRDHLAKSVLIEAIKESHCDCICKEALYI